MTQFKVGDRVRHVDDGDGSIGDGEVVRVGRSMVTVDWFNDSLDRKIPRGDLELVEEQTNRSYYGETPTMEELNSETGQTEFQFHGNTFEQNVNRHLTAIENILISKNKAYGDSALNPIRAFSKASRIEQLNVRIDDKISRIQRGTDFEDEDTVRDLIGYLTLLMIARESS